MHAAAASTPVTLDIGERLVAGNGLVRMGIDRGGRLNELRYGNGPNLASAGYWNFNGNGYDSEGMPIEQRFTVLEGTPEVVRQSDDLVEIAFARSPADPAFFKMALHYVLRRGEPGFHIYMTAEHDANMPPGFITQYAYNLRVAPEYFDYIAVDDQRRHVSHSCQEEAEAEAIMDATFRLADGRTVSKYNYTHAIEDGAFNVYGWAGPEAGIWWVQGSGEYYGSAPFRVLLTSHQTAKTPVIIWQVHCMHRGGYDIEFPPDDKTRWRKLYGPAFVYINRGEDYDTMWRDASRQVETVKQQWPPVWMAHELFPLRRGNLTGRLVFDDGVPAAGAHVILGPEGSHWSKENRGYHFWTEADARGRFHMEHVRPGRYALFAAGADQFYEFHGDAIAITAGETMALGTLVWKRVVHGERIWQIGTADRSTGEFANGDDFHHWGLWRRYPNEFPGDVDFEIGKSIECVDWNFAHWNWHSQRNAWNIHFELNEEPQGEAVLTFGIAAARGHSERGYGSGGAADLRVWVNDSEAGRFTVAGTGGVSYRSQRQSTRYSVKEIRFGAGLLRRGRNIISLRHALSDPYKHGEEKGESGSGPGCIMYDAIRLEIERLFKP
jgi:rhamnogalacturonan endolyase